MSYVDRFVKVLERVLYNIDHGIEVERHNILVGINFLNSNRDFFEDQSEIISKLRKQTPAKARKKTFSIVKPRKSYQSIINELDEILVPIKLIDHLNLLAVDDIPLYLENNREIKDSIDCELSCEIFRQCRELFRASTYTNSALMVMLFCQLPRTNVLQENYRRFVQYTTTNWCDSKHGYKIEPWVAYVIRCGILQKRLREVLL